MFLHELLHGLSYMLFGGLGRGEVKFGASLRGLMLYCHARRPMSLRAYRTSLVLPVLATGLLPSLVLPVVPSLWFALYCGLMVGQGRGTLRSSCI